MPCKSVRGLSASYSSGHTCPSSTSTLTMDADAVITTASLGAGLRPVSPTGSAPSRSCGKRKLPDPNPSGADKKSRPAPVTHGRVGDKNNDDEDGDDGGSGGDDGDDGDEEDHGNGGDDDEDNDEDEDEDDEDEDGVEDECVVITTVTVAVSRPVISGPVRTATDDSASGSDSVIELLFDSGEESTPAADGRVCAHSRTGPGQVTTLAAHQPSAHSHDPQAHARGHTGDAHGHSECAHGHGQHAHRHDLQAHAYSHTAPSSTRSHDTASFATSSSLSPVVANGRFTSSVSAPGPVAPVASATARGSSAVSMSGHNGDFTTNDNSGDEDRGLASPVNFNALLSAHLAKAAAAAARQVAGTCAGARQGAGAVQGTAAGNAQRAGRAGGPTFDSHVRSKQWSTRNQDQPSQLRLTAEVKRWFRCDACPHEFEAAVYSIARGSWCPFCASKRLCDDETCRFCFDRSFASHDRAKLWSTRNPVQPRQVARGARAFFWFSCDSCGHEFQSKLSKVSSGSWCKYCAGLALCDDDNCQTCLDRSFASHERALQWSTRNQVQPRQLALHSGTKHWFKCDKCSH